LIVSNCFGLSLEDSFNFVDNPWNGFFPESLVCSFLVDLLLFLVVAELDVFNCFVGVPVDMEVSGHDEVADHVGVDLGHVTDEIVITVAEIVFFHGEDHVPDVGEDWHGVFSNVMEPTFMTPAGTFIFEAPVDHGVSGFLELASFGVFEMHVDKGIPCGLVIFSGNAPEVFLCLDMDGMDWSPSIVHPFTEALITNWAFFNIIESSNETGLMGFTHEFSHEDSILVGDWLNITGLLDGFTEKWLVEGINSSDFDVVFVMVRPVASRDTDSGEGSKRKFVH